MGLGRSFVVGPGARMEIKAPRGVNLFEKTIELMFMSSSGCDKDSRDPNMAEFASSNQAFL